MSIPNLPEDPRERDSKRVRLQDATTLEALLQHSALPQKLLLDLSSENSNLSDFPQILNQLKNSYRMNSPPAMSTSSANVSLLAPSLSGPTPESDGKINELLKRLGIVEPQQEDVIESLRVANANLKKENDKKEYLIQDLLKKLHDALETIKIQAAQINDLQMQVGHNVHPAHHQQVQQMHHSPMPHHSPAMSNMSGMSSMSSMASMSSMSSMSSMMDSILPHQQSPQMMHHQHHQHSHSQPPSPMMQHHQSPSPQMMHHQHHQQSPSPQMIHHSHSQEENMYKIPAQINRARAESGLEIRVLQQPPSQAVYQRILRPFPTVAVMGVSSLVQSNNLFVEVSLLKQDEHDAQAFYQGVYSGKGNSPLEEKKNLIGGQLVQRSEAGSSPDTLVVVFRKLKILTTTAQQGGAFFLLKFVLKRYVENQFETVQNVACVISDPIEVFSHTLYLKGRPKTNSPSPRTAKRNASRNVKTEGDNNAAIAAATALMNARAASVQMNMSPSNASAMDEILPQDGGSSSSVSMQPNVLNVPTILPTASTTETF